MLIDPGWDVDHPPSDPTFLGGPDNASEAQASLNISRSSPCRRLRRHADPESVLRRILSPTPGARMILYSFRIFQNPTGRDPLARAGAKQLNRTCKPGMDLNRAGKDTALPPHRFRSEPAHSQVPGTTEGRGSSSCSFSKSFVPRSAHRLGRSKP